ncbi:MAG: DUF1501 domain-containing protein [Planctomycetes bacterium]|nr:DUF1501 domain-containing protein [Planctomycetota bacterium]
MDTRGQGIDRRGFIVGGVTVFGGLYLLGRHARADKQPIDTAPRTLLLVELSGGNDGLSCVVPYGDDAYFRTRERVGVKADEVLKFDDYRGFHPNLKKLREVYGDGHMAIVEGTGYPNPNHSHFTSQDIWHTARATGRASGDGWIGRTIAKLYENDRQVPHAVHVGQTLPFSLKSGTHPVVCFDEPPAYRWVSNGDSIVEAGGNPEPESKSRLDKIRSVVRNARQSSEDVRRAAATYQPRVEYANDPFSQDLRNAAALLQGGIGCRVLSVTQGGYDTHEDQKRRHDILMADLDRGLSTFLADMRGTTVGDNVLVLVFSEFGRRVADNASMGTDHGTAGPMFLMGTPVKGGVYGKHPSLTELYEGDLIHTTDFRQVYASVLERWFSLDSEPILGAKYDPIQGCLA